MERKNAWLSYTEADEKEMEALAEAYKSFLDNGKTERECVDRTIEEARAKGYVSLEEKLAKGEKEMEALAEAYKSFLDNGKTERECVDRTIEEARAKGYVSLEEKLAKGETVKAGDKVYTVDMNKIIALFHIGEEDITKGMNILGAHIDSPRIDIKQNPLYEDSDLAYLDTHYYGGIKKYQWVALPLALHGVIAKKDGSVVNVNIGEEEGDPIVYITDLLVHLAGKQMEKPASTVVEGESLDLLIGSRPLKDLPEDKKEAVKENVMKLERRFCSKCKYR